MRARCVPLVALVIMALIFGATQCLASCAAEASRPAAPPCHQKTHHHQGPAHETTAECGHDFLVPDALRLSVGHAAAVAFPLPAVETTPSLAVRVTAWVPAVSPPGSSSPFSSILRI